MATGLEVYNAIRSATAGLGAGSEFSVNTIDSYDLRKLKVSDLVELGYTEGIAKEVSSALLKGDVGPLGRSMGLRLEVNALAPRLFPET